MEQAAAQRDGLGARPPRRRWPWVLSVGAALTAVVLVAVLLARPWEEVVPTLRPEPRPEPLRSVSIDAGVVTDPDTDWSAIGRRLDQVGATGVELGAGRVEFTGFDWRAHPDAAAEPGADHLARAARALHRGSDGTDRAVGLIVDAFVPRWIKADPAVAGVSASGRRSRYQPSAAALYGEVGDRLVAYVRALGERYDPSQIEVTELFLDDCFGAADLALYRSMTGADDWPRDASGAIDADAAALDAWRSQVLADLLQRMRDALDDVRDGRGDQIELAMDVRVDWARPATGVLTSGHDYRVLLRSADRLVLWAYVRSSRRPADVSRLTAALADAGYDMARLTVSVGLWAGSSRERTAIGGPRLASTVRRAATHGITAVNVTPLSLFTGALWAALAEVWKRP